MIIIISGLPGAGKSHETAKIATDTLWRNLKYFKKTGIVRQLWSNIHFSDDIKEEYGPLIKYWTDPAELVKLRDVDVIWDEMATHIDATQWANMSLELKRWLQQHRKFGIDIYGNTQDFTQVDKSARRLCATLYHCTKIIGSRDISATRPPVKRPWGLIMIRSIDPQQYDEGKSPAQQESMHFPTFRFIRREYVNAFDTRQEISMGKYPPLRHIARDCELANCTLHKVIHI